MIEIKIQCDRCYKSDWVIPIDYTVKLQEHAASIGYVITKEAGLFAPVEKEYCKKCAKEIRDETA